MKPLPDSDNLYQTPTTSTRLMYLYETQVTSTRLTHLLLVSGNLYQSSPTSTRLTQPLPNSHHFFQTHATSTRLTHWVWFVLVDIVVPGGGSYVHVGPAKALPLRLRLRLGAGGVDGEAVGCPHDALCARQKPFHVGSREGVVERMPPYAYILIVSAVYSSLTGNI